jgi:hypothetical protein
MIHYLFFLLLIFMMMIYGYIYINFKIEKIRKIKNNQKKSKQPKKTKPIKLQKSLDQIHNGFNYPSINYKWGGCSENKPTTKAIKPGSWF